MSAEILRRAAAKIREDHGSIGGSTRWHVAECVGDKQTTRRVLGTYSLIHDGSTEVAIVRGFSGERKIVADFIASWNPAVARALADMFEAAIDEWGDTVPLNSPMYTALVAAARAYLGGAA